MTNGELMKPRYKVIALFPGCEEKVGDILYQHHIPNSTWGHEIFYTISEEPVDVERIVLPVIENYPHLFCRLDWWEERKIEDMPEFIKDATDGEVSKPIWRQGEMQIGERTWSIRNRVMCFYSPATEAEYLAALNTTQQQDNG